jgi:signal peptidase II
MASIKRVELKYWILGILGLSILILDQVTKLIVLDRFRLGETLSIWKGYFNLTYIRNTGAAFGMLAEAAPAFRIPFFLLVPVIALIIIGYIFRRLPANSVKLSTALSLVMGGAIGNLVDRIRLGYVVDFLDFHYQYRTHFPAFNVADAAICVGVAILMLDLLLEKPEEVEPPPKKLKTARVVKSEPKGAKKRTAPKAKTKKKKKPHVSSAV